MEKQSGKFKSRKGFTAVPNSVVTDTTLSSAALGLYTKIFNLITRENFTLYKSYLMTICKEGERAFNTMWTELKDHGYLIQTKFKGKDGKWEYEYELLDEPFKTNTDNEKTDSSDNTIATAEAQKPDPQNVGVVKEKPGVRNAGVENVGVNNKNVLSKTKSNTYSSSSSSINTPREEATDIVPLDDDEEKEVSQIVKTVFKVQEGKRLTSLAGKYGCDGNMIYPALKLALENRADKLVPYVKKIFEDWQNNGIKHLQDIGIDSIDSDERINEYVELYKDQLECENQDPSKYVQDYEIFRQIFGDKPYFSDKSEEFKALSKLYPDGKAFDVCRSVVLNYKPINDGIDLLMRRDRFEGQNYGRYL